MDTSFRVVIKCLSSESSFHTEIPGSLTVKQLKELIRQYHPRAPLVKQQKLVFRTILLPNYEVLADVVDNGATLYLTIDAAPAEEASPYQSTSFLQREAEYLANYRTHCLKMPLRARKLSKPLQGAALASTRKENKLCIYTPQATKLARRHPISTVLSFSSRAPLQFNVLS